MLGRRKHHVPYRGPQLGRCPYFCKVKYQWSYRSCDITKSEFCLKPHTYRFASVGILGGWVYQVYRRRRASVCGVGIRPLVCNTHRSSGTSWRYRTPNPKDQTGHNSWTRAHHDRRCLYARSQRRGLAGLSSRHFPDASRSLVVVGRERATKPALVE